MTILIVVSAILILTAVVWLVGRIFSIAVCPICAGVSLAWFSMLTGMFSGWLSVADFQIPTAILMGGSVVGIAYKLEGKLQKNRSSLLWKALFIPAGFALAYGLILLDKAVILLVALPLLVIIAVFVARNGDDTGSGAGKSGAVQELIDKMKKCC